MHWIMDDVGFELFGRRLGSGFLPTAMLDAGDTAWSGLVEVVERRMDNLPALGILEICFVNPNTRLPLLEWCTSHGHDLFQLSADGDRTWIWIAKR